MDLSFTEADRAFREEARTWLRANVPSESRPNEGPAMRDFDLGWQRAQYEGGWAGINWPAEYGGRGLSVLEQLIWFEEYALAGAPTVGSCFVAVNHAGPTLILWGDDDQKALHLPLILRGDVLWCQGFSEPGAGSDLAALQTRAVVDGDELVVNGQKIWTSWANLARYQELLVRTEPDSPKHKGITWVICDMHSPGIDIRPIETMAGGAHFCEVFYDNVRIPLTNVVGQLNEGWRVAMSTLMFERGTAFMSTQIELAREVEDLIDQARTTVGPDGRRPAIADDELARRLATVRAEVAALRAMTYLNASRVARSGVPGPEGSIVRLYHALVTQRVYRLALDVLGPAALDSAGSGDPWAHRYLSSYATTIAGGTAEIQRNIIGERVLGLPR